MKFNRIWFKTCIFRIKPLMLAYGGGVEYGKRFQWLGLEIKFGRAYD